MLDTGGESELYYDIDGHFKPDSLLILRKATVLKGDEQNEKNVSAKKTPEKKGTRIHEENGDKKRTPAAFKETREGQGETVLLK
jgi:hypothetical protein